MKKFILNIMLFSSIIMAFTACKKDKTEPEPIVNPTTQKTVPAQYAKKWYVNTTKSINAVDYVWIEFTTNGHYFIMFDDGTAISGSCYYSSSNNRIILENYGYVEIVNIDSTNFSFILYINATAETSTIFTTVGSQTVTGTTANLLCKTWKVVEYYFVDQNTNDTSYAVPNNQITYSRFDVNFTSYGTYFTSEEYTYNGTPGTIYDNRYWRFADGSESILCYGLTQAQSDNCEYSCNITTLNSSSLIIEGNNGGYTYKARCIVN